MFRIGEEDGENDGQNGREIFAHEVDDVFVVPVIERSFCNLEVLAIDAPCQLVEKRAHNFAEFVGIDDVQYLLHLAKEHDLFWRVNLWPILE